jgi:DNA-binding response OmpR family regulator
MRVLLIDGHDPANGVLERLLQQEGFAVEAARGVREGDNKVRSVDYDVILLDLILPREDGFSALQGWRRSGLRTHVLALTACDRPADKVRSLNSGADDCLTRPFEVEELLARVRALARRAPEPSDPVLRIHDLEIDTASHMVKRGGRTIPLTAREYALLEFLAVRRGRPVSRTTIRESLYGRDHGIHSNVIDVYIRYLRSKIDQGFDPPLIVTRRGQGYMLQGS